MSKIRVSIIVPVYNVEKYIVRCMNSIASQTFHGIEAILVDDCGQDGSLRLIDNFLCNYTGDVDFRIIHHTENRGQSAARNSGIRSARGKYIYFLDSDDYISDDCIETLFSVVAKDNSVQMVVGNYKIIGALHFEPMLLQQRSYTSEEIIAAQWDYRIYTMPWNKLILREFIVDNNLFFQEGIIHEDNLWSFCSACYYSRVYVILKPTYYYVVHKGSTINSRTNVFHEEQLFEVLKYLIKFIFSANPVIKPNIRKNPTIFRFIQDEAKRLIMAPYLDGNVELAKRRYEEIRTLDFYSQKELMLIHKLKLEERIRALHLALPVKLGFWLYCRQNKGNNELLYEKMKLTIITINYNNLSGLRRTIPSVLSQTYTGYEYIVIDGGSTDGSKEYIQSQERIDYWVSEPDNGVYNAMNKGVRMAHGEYCIFMNSGDTFFSALSLEEAIPLLNGSDFYTGNTVCIDGEKAYPWLSPETITMELMLNGALSHQATFSRTEILRKHPFNEKYKIVSDWELFFEEWYKNGCKYEAIHPIIAIYYMDGISSINKELDSKERSEVIERLIDGRDADSCSKNEGDAKRQKEQRRKNKLEAKLNKAMSKKPLSRDLKIIRNGIKYLLKDLFN